MKVSSKPGAVQFQNDLTVSLESELEQHLSDFDFYRQLSSAEYDSEGTRIVRVLDTKAKKKASPSAEFSAWLGKEVDPQFNMNGVYVWIVGKLTVRSSRAEVKEVVSIFSAPVCLINPGVGGGAIEFDARHIVRLPLEAKHSLISFAIGKTLNSEKETYRGLFTLHAPRSSFHTIRWLKKDKYQKVLYESPWSDLHVFIPKTAYRAVKLSGIKNI